MSGRASPAVAAASSNQAAAGGYRPRPHYHHEHGIPGLARRGDRLLRRAGRRQLKVLLAGPQAAYEKAVLHPMEELLDELAVQYGPGRIFRPYRDVRFSADKSPYKTAIGATLGEGGYIQLSAAGLAAGWGTYMMSADQLQRYRQAVDAEPSGPDLAQRVAAIRDAGIEVTAHDRVKTAPRGYPKDHPRIDLLCLKGLVAWREWPAGKWLATTQAKVCLLEFLAQAGPLDEWLAAHVGPSRTA